MSTVLTNGSVTFGDGTTLSSGLVPYSAVTGTPTQLSQFTNNLGNYGGWMLRSSSAINSTITNQYWDPQMGVVYTAGKMGIVVNNCNCVCHCNC